MQASWHVECTLVLHPFSMAFKPSAQSQYPDHTSSITEEQALSKCGSRGPFALQPPVWRHETQPVPNYYKLIFIFIYIYIYILLRLAHCSPAPALHVDVVPECL